MTGFPRVKLGLLAHITAGQGAPQSEAEYGEEGYPFIKAAHMQGLSCGSLLEAQCLRVSDEVAQRRKLKIYKAGSIIFAKSGMSCMKGYVHCLTQDAYLVNHLACITLTATERAFAPYLKYYFLKHSPSRLVKDEGYPSISLTDISKLEIPLPPLAEQERIAAELDAVVATLKKRQTQLAELNALVEARFVELFGGERLPTVAIGDEFKTTSGGTPPSKVREYYDGGSVPWLNSGEVNRGIVDYAENFITELGLKNSSAKWIPVDSVLVAMYGATVGKVGLLRIPATTNQAVCSILPNSQYCPLYLYFAVKSQESWMRSQALGGAQPNISQTVIKKMTIPKPPLELQERFAAEVERVEAIKAKVRDGIAETQTLFDALTQKYFG